MRNYANNSITVLSYFETSDYNLFVNTGVNREINTANLNSIVESMKQVGLLVPITVAKLGNKYHILDGGHRFEACKICKIPVKFLLQGGVADTVKTMVILNKNKSWQDRDYVKGYASSGNQNYVEYQNFEAKYPDFKSGSITMILAVDGGSGYTSKMFRDEKFVCGNLTSAYRLADDLMALKASNPREYNNIKFVQALIPFWLNPVYNHKRFMQSVRKPKYAKEFDGIYNVTVFKAAISDVYNDGLPMNKRIY